VFQLILLRELARIFRFVFHVRVSLRCITGVAPRAIVVMRRVSTRHFPRLPYKTGMAPRALYRFAGARARLDIVEELTRAKQARTFRPGEHENARRHRAGCHSFLAGAGLSLMFRV
jgi:hypothetical protein